MGGPEPPPPPPSPAEYTIVTLPFVAAADPPPCVLTTVPVRLPTYDDPPAPA